MAASRVHGDFLAGEVGEMAGVSGNTIGQWARWGYIRSSQSEAEPRRYSVEDVAEAAIVSELLERGVPHSEVRKAIERLEGYGDWPLSEAPLGTTRDGGRPRIVLRERDETWVLTARGWQLAATPPAVDGVRVRLRRGSRPAATAAPRRR